MRFQQTLCIAFRLTNKDCAQTSHMLPHEVGLSDWCARLLVTWHPSISGVRTKSLNVAERKSVAYLYH